MKLNVIVFSYMLNTGFSLLFFISFSTTHRQNTILMPICVNIYTNSWDFIVFFLVFTHICPIFKRFSLRRMRQNIKNSKQKCVANNNKQKKHLFWRTHSKIVCKRSDEFTHANSYKSHKRLVSSSSFELRNSLFYCKKIFFYQFLLLNVNLFFFDNPESPVKVYFPLIKLLTKSIFHWIKKQIFSFCVVFMLKANRKNISYIYLLFLYFRIEHLIFTF